MSLHVKKNPKKSVDIWPRYGRLKMTAEKINFYISYSIRSSIRQSKVRKEYMLFTAFKEDYAWLSFGIYFQTVIVKFQPVQTFLIRNDIYILWPI